MTSRQSYKLNQEVDQSFKWRHNMRGHLCLFRRGYKYTISENPKHQRLRLRCASRLGGKSKQVCKAVINMDFDKMFYNDSKDVHTCQKVEVIDSAEEHEWEEESRDEDHEPFNKPGKQKFRFQVESSVDMQSEAEVHCLGVGQRVRDLDVDYEQANSVGTNEHSSKVMNEVPDRTICLRCMMVLNHIELDQHIKICKQNKEEKKQEENKDRDKHMKYGRQEEQEDEVENARYNLQNSTMPPLSQIMTRHQVRNFNSNLTLENPSLGQELHSLLKPKPKYGSHQPLSNQGPQLQMITQLTDLKDEQKLSAVKQSNCETSVQRRSDRIKMQVKKDCSVEIIGENDSADDDLLKDPNFLEGNHIKKQKYVPIQRIHQPSLKRQKKSEDSDQCENKNDISKSLLIQIQKQLIISKFYGKTTILQPLSKSKYEKLLQRQKSSLNSRIPVTLQKKPIEKDPDELIITQLSAYQEPTTSTTTKRDDKYNSKLKVHKKKLIKQGDDVSVVSNDEKYKAEQNENNYQGLNKVMELLDEGLPNEHQLNKDTWKAINKLKRRKADLSQWNGLKNIGKDKHLSTLKTADENDPHQVQQVFSKVLDKLDQQFLDESIFLIPQQEEVTCEQLADLFIGGLMLNCTYDEREYFIKSIDKKFFRLHHQDKMDRYVSANNKMKEKYGKVRRNNLVVKE